ncbi:MAG TPA: hypothetical protein VMU29_12130 [Smithella sp.]|nr:hypothetical protein [Smithella sp.]
MFLEAMVRAGATDPFDGSEITLHSDIHHKMGKIGYADQWAIDNEIPLVIDPRHFLAMNRPGHTWVTEHSKEAIEKGWSESRAKVLII